MRQSLRGIRKLGRRIRHLGWRHHCPFCRANINRLLPDGVDLPVLQRLQVVGGGLRLQSCPVCGSGDRERLVYLYLRHQTAIFDNPLALLHVAPETRIRPLLARLPKLRYLTADIAPGRAMVQMDITDIQYPDAHFDAIICNHVLEHIIYDGRAMRELRRVLKPGGWALLQVPISKSLPQTLEDPTITGAPEREVAFGQFDHVRIYTAGDFVDRLAAAGFTIERFVWTRHPQQFGGARNRFGLNPDEEIFIARKA